MQTATVVTADSTGVVRDLQEISRLTESVNLSPDVVERFLDLLNGCLEVSGVETLTADGTCELRVGLKLSDGLREFVGALRAGNINGGIVQVDGHGRESITFS